jgi:hypothetical protein
MHLHRWEEVSAAVASSALSFNQGLHLPGRTPLKKREPNQARLLTLSKRDQKPSSISKAITIEPSAMANSCDVD